MKSLKSIIIATVALLLGAAAARASEANLAIPDLHHGSYDRLGGAIALASAVLRGLRHRRYAWN